MRVRAEELDRYPEINGEEIDRLLAKEIARDKHKIIVLDDDPTGVQTVHDISVYTTWDVQSIRRGFAEDKKLFYILTNSRAMTAKETERIHRDITAHAATVAGETGKPYLYMSRSDSTLRGHYPLEPALLREGTEKDGFPVDGEILCFFFPEGGRYTIGDVHYVRQGQELVPAAETEFARDVTFGYLHSSIPEYIEEKTGGAYRAEDVTCISLEELRAADIDGVKEKLMRVSGFGKVCVNAVSYCDLKVFCVALYRAMAAGKRFLFRTAAALVKVMGGIPDKPLLTRRDMVLQEGGRGGLVVIGSHTEKTTAQLEALGALAERIALIAFDSDKVLEGDTALEAEVARCVAEEERAMLSGKTAVAYTRRRLLKRADDTKEAALLRSVKISNAVQALAGRLSVRPAFLIAKGGITSSDIGTKALRVKRATVLGQVAPGVPVWQTGEESLFPGVPYVIFPGNVGEADTLREVVQTLTAEP